MSTDPFTLRDSSLARAAFWVTTAWAAQFAVTLAWMGDRVTSKQWQYLMSVPFGGKWVWFAIFGTGALVAAAGLTRRAPRATAAGLFVIASGCSAIAVFYLAAPLIDPGLMTLGYSPWFLAAAVFYFCAAVNVRPVQWF